MSCVILILNSVEVSFAQVISLGRLKLLLEASYRGTYEDNVFLENRNTKNDFIHRITPSVRVEYGDVNGQADSVVGKIAISQTRFSAGYSTDFVFYNDFSDNRYIGHDPFISVLYNSPSGIYLKADEAFKYTEDVYGSLNQYNIGIKTKRWDNTVGFTIGYQSRYKLGVDVTYMNYITRYDELIDQWQDRMDHRIATSIYYKATPKLSFFAQYRHTIADYDKQNDGILLWTDNTSQDYTLDDYFLGISFDPTAKIRGELKLGYGEKNFENEVDPFGRSYIDESSWIAETSLSYRPRERTGLKMMLSRSLDGSPDADSASYIRTLMGVSVSQDIGNRMTASGGLYWERQDFSDENKGIPKKYFNIYSATASIDFRIMRWLTAGLSYTYQSRNVSDDLYEAEEYDVNRISLYTTARF